MRRVSRGFSGWRAGKQLIKTVITTEQCRSSFCVIDNNKELVMPNTVAQCLSSMFCFWMKNNQRYSDKKERMTETLAKLDLCSLSTKCFFFFRSYGTTTSTCRCPFLRNPIFNWRASPKGRNTRSSTSKIVNNFFLYLLSLFLFTHSKTHESIGPFQLVFTF